MDARNGWIYQYLHKKDFQSWTFLVRTGENNTECTRWFNDQNGGNLIVWKYERCVCVQHYPVKMYGQYFLSTTKTPRLRSGRRSIRHIKCVVCSFADTKSSEYTSKHFSCICFSVCYFAACAWVYCINYLI